MAGEIRSGRDLTPLFAPESIAVVGATDREGSIGHMVLRNLQLDYPGRLYGVRRTAEPIDGIPCFTSVTELPEAVDLILLVVPALSVADIVLESAGRHRAVCVLSGGFQEAGTAGRRLQEELRAALDITGMPTIGPNCIGYLNLLRRTAAGFMNVSGIRPKLGTTALVSQSGGFGSFILQRSIDVGLGLGFFASTGNEVDVSVADVMAYLVERQEIDTLMVFAETVRKPDSFVSAALRAAELGKAIVVVRPYATEAVRRAAKSHTASVVGSTAVFDSVCRQYGVVTADSVEEMVDFAQVLHGGRRMAGNRIGIVTQSGGSGVLMAGAAETAGLDVPELSAEVQASITPLTPEFASAVNPVDVTASLVGAGFPETNYEQICSAVLASPQIDALVAMAFNGFGVTADGLRHLHRITDKPMVAVMAVNPNANPDTAMPTFQDPVRAVRALGALNRISGRQVSAYPGFVPDSARVTTIAALLASVTDGTVDERTMKEVLARYNIPVVPEIVVHSAQAAAKAAEKLGGRVVMKVLARSLLHKTELDLVRVDISSPEEASDAYLELIDTGNRAQPSLDIEGVLVQKFVPARIEIAAGFTRDTAFGPIVAVGLGGVQVEMLGQPQLLRPPFSSATAAGAVGAIAQGRIRHDARGLRYEEIQRLAKILVSLGQLALEQSAIESVDVNPIRAGDGGIYAVDALAVLLSGETNQHQGLCGSPHFSALGHCPLGRRDRSHETAWSTQRPVSRPPAVAPVSQPRRARGQDDGTAPPLPDRTCRRTAPAHERSGLA